MREYRRGAHTVFEIHLHLVWVTKHRRPVLTVEVGQRVRDLIREICGQEDVHIIRGHVSKDHIHLFVSIPPQVTISRLVQRLKGKSAYKLFQEFPHLRKKFWGNICGRAATFVAAAATSQMKSSFNTLRTRAMIAMETFVLKTNQNNLSLGDARTFSPLHGSHRLQGGGVFTV